MILQALLLYDSCVYLTLTSVGMVLLWLTGDAAKTIYFVLRQSPFQFVMCGTLQCIVDVAVLVQVFIY